MGNGAFGTAFLTDKNLVIKITGDRDEYKTAQEIKEKVNGKYTPRFFKLDKLSDSSYAIVMELVRPIRLSAQENTFLKSFADKFTHALEYGHNTEVIKAELTRLGNPSLTSVLNGVAECMTGLYKVGIINADIRAENIGTINNRIVMLDVMDEKQVTMNESLMGTVSKLINLQIYRL